MSDRTRPPLERQLVDALEGLDSGSGQAATPCGRDLTHLYDVQLASRHCDLAARWLRSRGKGYYTIGSAGHESNAILAMATRSTDPALLHYRSGGFYLGRAGLAGVSDILAGVVAATSEPISGGRHKVFGRHDLAIIPQTSTIASHLPRAVGVAFAIDRATKLKGASPWPADAITVCSFGDASTNHSVAAGAFNSAIFCAYQRLPLPLLFVCEDNGLGISVRTPAGWIETAFGSRPHLRYAAVDGDDPLAVAEVASELTAWVRSHRKPAFLHLRTVRYGGHAGTDVEAAYRSAADIRVDADRDPILGTARVLLAGGWTNAALLQRHDEIADMVHQVAADLADAEQLTTADEVIRPLAMRRPDEVERLAKHLTPPPANGEPMTFAQAVNTTLATLLDRQPNVLVFGEDVAVKGGVYGVTKGLVAKAGAGRVFDTLLDETSILGLANGSAISGFVPIPEIEYLAYLHNAEDQLRGEATTLSFFSNGQYRNGLVVRVAGYGYQEGFGGHFHNDDAVAVLRDIPGLVVGSPSRPDDAAAMLTTCVAAAQVDGTVSVFLEPIARYHTQDLYEPGDREWMAAIQADHHVPIGSARTYGHGVDLTIITCGNGVLMSLRVARRLAGRGVGVRVVDLRWLSPLPIDDLIRETHATRAVLVADETRASGGWSEGVVTALVDGGIITRIGRVTSKDSFIPLGDAAKLVLLSEDEIEAAAYRLLHR
ncbi:MAG: thiamine pyrophosphate-dependent enzyme [Actinomycetota bacterium]|nr:thiamine pyrophosphate-dependent enzyme [Actinomycetota bacterium]